MLPHHSPPTSLQFELGYRVASLKVGGCGPHGRVATVRLTSTLHGMIGIRFSKLCYRSIVAACRLQLVISGQ